MDKIQFLGLAVKGSSGEVKGEVARAVARVNIDLKFYPRSRL